MFASNNHFTGNSSMEPQCCFCEEAEKHIATNGPKGTKIVQYFACQNFVEMATKDRFEELKNKIYCFQCLFSVSASQNKGKNHVPNGLCQRDFVFMHKLNGKYPIKKLVRLS